MPFLFLFPVPCLSSWPYVTGDLFFVHYKPLYLPFIYTIITVPEPPSSCNITSLLYNQSSGELLFIDVAWDPLPVSHMTTLYVNTYSSIRLVSYMVILNSIISKLPLVCTNISMISPSSSKLTQWRDVKGLGETSHGTRSVSGLGRLWLLKM